MIRFRNSLMVNASKPLSYYLCFKMLQNFSVGYRWGILWTFFNFSIMMIYNSLYEATIHAPKQTVNVSGQSIILRSGCLSFMQSSYAFLLVHFYCHISFWGKFLWRLRNSSGFISLPLVR